MSDRTADPTPPTDDDVQTAKNVRYDRWGAHTGPVLDRLALGTVGYGDFCPPSGT